MLFSVFVFPGLILILELLTSVECICIHGRTTCRCGISDIAFSVSCVDDHDAEDLCHIYEHCETCENDVAHCLTCHNGHSGRFCDHEEDSDSWHHDSGTPVKAEVPGRFVSRELTCPELKSPKLGSISCWYQGYEKECTGRCLPGHSFESNVREIKLSCQSGVWMPYSSFPPCISKGFCKIDILSAGYYNCTTGGRGTYCDITCNGRRYNPVRGRFYCYPGSSWDPPLPYCAQEIEANEETERDREPTCECRNGGSCHLRTRECVCPEGYRGRLCEIKQYDTRRTCRRPEQVENGNMKNLDGTTVRQNQEFYEGSSVAYSCRSDFALVGESFRTCTKYGTWSDSVPICRPLQDETSEQYKTRNLCPYPEQVENGDMKNSDGSIVTRNQQFYEGSTVVYSCRSDFALVGESLLTCTKHGTWSDSVPKCRTLQDETYENTSGDLVYCDDPGVDPNGIKTVSPWIDSRKKDSYSEEMEYPQGTRIDYSCKDGYDLQGENSLLCLSSGKWSSPIPTCRPKQGEIAYCQNPDDIRNGRKVIIPFIDPRTNRNVVQNSADLPQGVKVVFTCDNGFAIKGSKIIECVSTGSWSAATPTCEAQGCGHSYYTMTRRIIKGEQTVEGQWPWQVAYAENRRSGMIITCGAVLISSQIVVTAAHCILPRQLDKTYLFFGKFYSDFNKDDGQVLSRKATEFIVYPKYDREILDNDIALVRFDPEVPYNTRIQPVCLPTSETTQQDLKHDSTGWVTGWGATENGTSSEILLMGGLPVVSTTQCRENYRKLNLAVKITNSMYCAGFENGEVDSCTGDSGGPMVFYNNQSQSYVLEGLVSFGVQGPTGSCGQQNRYGVYTKVSNFVQWIRHYI